MLTSVQLEHITVMPMQFATIHLGPLYVLVRQDFQETERRAMVTMIISFLFVLVDIYSPTKPKK